MPFKRYIPFISVLLIVLAVISCRHADGVSVSKLTDKELSLRRIAVLPFQGLSPEEAVAMAVQQGGTADALKKANEPDSPERIVQDLFWGMLAAMKKIDLVSPDRTGGLLEQVRGISMRASVPQAAAAIGRELGADAVLLCYVYRWRERRGNAYAVEKPASVAFEVQLFRSSDGVLVWKSIFDKTQTSLMENVLRASYFFKDRGRWISARELAAEGVEEMLRRFPVPAEEP